MLKKAKRVLGIIQHLNIFPGGRYILVACMPKSGSTFLTRVLVEITSFREFPLLYAGDENEQDLYLPAMIDARVCNTVAQQHMRATTMNIRLLKQYGISPAICLMLS